MKLLYDNALDRWQRVKDLDLRLKQSGEHSSRYSLERERREAIQQVRLRAA